MMMMISISIPTLPITPLVTSHGPPSRGHRRFGFAGLGAFQALPLMHQGADLRMDPYVQRTGLGLHTGICAYIDIHIYM